MYSDLGIVILGLVLFVWLSILNFLLFRQGKFLSKLFPKSGQRDIRKKFEEVIQSVSRSNLEIKSLNDKLIGLEKSGLVHIQKLEVLRYNPYGDTGGDQSFSLALLDKLGDGVVITSLHSREATRIFAKPVIKGKAGKHQFSSEEEEVVKKALKNYE
ncbi:MAG: hypothetical protein G01um101493_394 [Microgenomates group bacterium Gr01-1014_93]|nr:MAG: hypothetical protein G01um101493_394 [Microgenomates group bacterium Gr01-1014_93]